MRFYAYDLALEYIRALRELIRIQRQHCPEEADQLQSAANSIARNVASGSGRFGRDPAAVSPPRPLPPPPTASPRLPVHDLTRRRSDRRFAAASMVAPRRTVRGCSARGRGRPPIRDAVHAASNVAGVERSSVASA